MEQQIDYIGQFLTFLLTERRVSKNTFVSYKGDLEQLNLFFSKKKVAFDCVTKQHLHDFLKYSKENGCSPRTLARKISALKLFFAHLAERFGLLNPTKNLSTPHLEKKLPQYLSEQEVQVLLKAANSDTTPKGLRNRAMLYMLYATGMRVSELVNLTIGQLQFDTGFINVMGKGSKERSIPLPRNVVTMLSEYLKTVYPKLLPPTTGEVNIQASWCLFPAGQGEQVHPLSRQAMWVILKNILRKAAITTNISPHSLRHSLATHLLKSGVDIRSLQMILGHENLNTVQTYTHLCTTHVRKIYDKKHPRA